MPVLESVDKFGRKNDGLRATLQMIAAIGSLTIAVAMAFNSSGFFQPDILEDVVWGALSYQSERRALTVNVTYRKTQECALVGGEKLSAAATQNEYSHVFIVSPIPSRPASKNRVATKLQFAVAADYDVRQPGHLDISLLYVCKNNRQTPVTLPTLYLPPLVGRPQD